VLNPLFFTVGCGVLLLADSDTGAVGLLGYRLAVLASIVAWYAHRVRLRPTRLPGERSLEPVGSFTAARVLFIVQAQSSILLAGLISAESAGLYTAALRSATLIAAAMAALAMLAGPTIAVAAHQNDLPALVPQLRVYARMAFVLALLPATVMFVWPDVVLGFFGDEFTSAADALRILAGAQLALTLFGPADMFATMANLERSVARWTAVAAVSQVTFALVLLSADELTVTRLAAIDALGTLTWNIGLWWSCRTRVGTTAAAF
jgi:O-antigen/teichoic acid export membrane protein